MLLNAIPKVLIDDCRVQTFKGLGLVPYQTQIHGVRQQVIDLTPAERRATLGPTRGKDMVFGHKPFVIGCAHDGIQTAVRFIKLEDLPDDLCLASVDNEFAARLVGMRIISQRGYATHPEAFPF